LSFFNELKRRNVFRIGIAYSIVSWLIAQIADLAADAFFAPDWVMKMIITVLFLGFPVALVMAWAYELTSEGLRRESDVGHGQSSVQANASKLDRTITIALILAVVYFSFDKFVLDPRRDAVMLESVTQQAPEASEPTSEPVPLDQSSSIAVLPFVNMSDDAGNEYFSEGLSEELLNLLVRIPELRVAARTSSFSYKGKDTKIAQIGEELGVTHVLEGSVRKSGSQIRITAQLIKADVCFNLW
jgi:TolB-like protein